MLLITTLWNDIYKIRVKIILVTSSDAKHSLYASPAHVEELSAHLQRSSFKINLKLL